MSVNRTKTEGYSLRFPDGLRERVKAAAESNGRSLNAEIIATLEREYPIDFSVQIQAAIKTLEAELESAPEEKREALRKRIDGLINSIFN